jgi:translation initiation factor IF-3
VIDEEGNNLGILKTDEALKIAKERGLDLIEVSPLAKPPVARILDFDKYRYQQEKKLKKNKSSTKEEIKQVQISVRSAQNDLMVKAKRANSFLAKGNVVRIVMVLRGRERANRDFAKGKLKDFLAGLDTHKMTMNPKFGGRGIITQIQK